MRLIFILIIIVLICSWFYLGHWIYNNKKIFWKTIWTFATALPFLIFYFLANPSVNYYKDQFTLLSGFEFPSNGIFIDYSSSFPDLQDNYGVCGLFKAPITFINKLNTTIPKIQDGQHKPRMFCNLNAKSKYFFTNILDIDDEERKITGILGINTESNVVHFQFFVN